MRVSDKERKKMEYIEYIKNHQAIVQKVWLSVKEKITDKNIRDDIEKNIDKHDESKFSQAEFEGYRNYFFPLVNEEKDRMSFLKAWNSHQKSNKHHWDYWILRDNGVYIALDMDFCYIIEMLCDWTAMSINFKNSVKDYYEKKSKIMVSEKTKIIIEDWISVFETISQDLSKDISTK